MATDKETPEERLKYYAKAAERAKALRLQKKELLRRLSVAWDGREPDPEGCDLIRMRQGKYPNTVGHELYPTWVQMKSRCYNKNHPKYKYYGARGISVCDQWKSDFAQFLLDMGPRPEGHTIDRINVNGNYEPSNCRWATHQEQGLNQQRHAK